MNATQSCNDWGFGDPDVVDERAEEAIRDRADIYAFAWLTGKFNEVIDDGDTLATLVGAELCDVPGNALHTVLAIVQRAARGGDIEAGKLIERLAHEHAQAAYERGALL
jgi:hypothetical protein